MYGARPKLKEPLKPRPWEQVCRFYIGQYNMVKGLGALPKAGGLDDQDWLTMAAFQVIQGEIAEHEQTEMQKAKQQSAAPAKGARR